MTDGVAIHQYKLDDKERAWLGLKKPKRPRGNIHVCYPEHHGSRAVMWTSRWITGAELAHLRAEHPSLQIIEWRELCRT